MFISIFKTIIVTYNYIHMYIYIYVYRICTYKHIFTYHYIHYINTYTTYIYPCKATSSHAGDVHFRSSHWLISAPCWSCCCVPWLLRYLAWRDPLNCEGCRSGDQSNMLSHKKQDIRRTSAISMRTIVFPTPFLAS